MDCFEARRIRLNIGRALAQQLPQRLSAREVGRRLGLSDFNVRRIEQEALYKIYNILRREAARGADAVHR